MKSVDFKNLRSKDDQQLTEILKEKIKLKQKAEMEVVRGGEKNTKTVKNIKIAIAQLMTLLREKDMMGKEVKK